VKIFSDLPKIGAFAPPVKTKKERSAHLIFIVTVSLHPDRGVNIKGNVSATCQIHTLTLCDSAIPNVARNRVSPLSWKTSVVLNEFCPPALTTKTQEPCVGLISLVGFNPEAGTGVIDVHEMYSGFNARCSKPCQFHIKFNNICDRCSTRTVRL
jgi:hypothetical protein